MGSLEAPRFIDFDFGQNESQIPEGPFQDLVDSLHSGDMNEEEAVSVAGVRVRSALLERNALTLLTEKAIHFSAMAHSGKYRKVDKEIPYIFHPYEVALKLLNVTQDQDDTAVSLLHDVLEDSPKVKGRKIYTYNVIRKEFNQNVADKVQSLTTDDTIADPLERKLKAIRTVIEHSTNVMLIKSADLESNIENLRHERKLKDINGEDLGNRVFEEFRDRQLHTLERFTRSLIMLSDAYRIGTGEINPFSRQSIAQLMLLIHDSHYEELGKVSNVDSNTTNVHYEELISSLKMELENIDQKTPDEQDAPAA